VDVRSADSYQASHIAGAISIPLDVIQTDPSGVLLDKNQWIITYCS
jgi:rhodanese-related sulfurtransferase